MAAYHTIREWQGQVHTEFRTQPRRSNSGHSIVHPSTSSPMRPQPGGISSIAAATPPVIPNIQWHTPSSQPVPLPSMAHPGPGWHTPGSQPMRLPLPLSPASPMRHVPPSRERQPSGPGILKKVRIIPPVPGSVNSEATWANDYPSTGHHRRRLSIASNSSQIDLWHKEYQYTIGSRSMEALNRSTIPKWMTHENAPPQLNPLLRGDANQQPILIFDLSESLFNPLHANSAGATTGGHLSAGELSQPATFPALARMSITHDGHQHGHDIRWVINMLPANARNALGAVYDDAAQFINGSVFVTVHDVLHAVHQTLHKQIRHVDWVQVSEAQQRHIARAYKKRLEGERRTRSSESSELEQKQGVKWVDYLLENHIFNGLELEGEDVTYCKTARLLVRRG